MNLHISASVNTKLPEEIAVRWVAVRFPKLKKEIHTGVALHIQEGGSINATEVLPTSTPLTQPYWLRAEGTAGMFHVDDPQLIGTAENTPAFPIEEVFEVGGQTLIINDEPVEVSTDSKGDQIRRRLDVIPPVSLRFTSDVAVLTP